MSYRHKEACFIVLDASMSNEEKSARFPNDSKFQLGKKLADHYMRRFLEEARKSDEVGIIIVGGSGEEQEGAEEIEQIQSATVEHRKKIEAIKPQTPGDHDIADAFKLAADKISERVQHYKFKRTIVLITDGASVQSLKALKEAKEDFEQAEMASVEVLGIDFNVAEGRSDECVDGQATLEKVFGKDKIKVIKTENAFRPHKRVVGQVKKWQGQMEVSSYCKFNVIMVARIAEERLKPLEKRSKLALEQIEQEEGETAAERALQEGQATVSMDRKYMSSENPSEEREVPPEERSRGYRYGKDILPMFPADEEAMRLEDTNACLKVIGIINRAELIRNYMITSTNCIVAHPDSSNSQEGFAAFVQALHELDKVATCRYVRKDGTNPKFVALIPGLLPEGSPAAGGPCLWHIQIPTTEDIRDYPFESLAKFDPSEGEESAAEEYVKAMTLQKDDAKESHRFDPEFTFNPVIARYWDAVHAKALEPDRPLPQASPFITAMISADPNVIKRARKPLRNFAKALPLRRIVRKRDAGGATGIDSTDQEAAPVAHPGAGGNIASRIAAAAAEDAGEDWFDNERKSIVEFVGTTTPVEDFNAMLEESTTGTRDRTQEAFQQMSEVILKIYREGGAVFYDKVMDCIRTFRDGALKFHGEPAFNKFLTVMKQELLLQGPNNPLWERLVQSKTTLISTDESHGVDTSAKAAQDFLLVTAETQKTTQATTQGTLTQPSASDDDLFDMME